MKVRLSCSKNNYDINSVGQFLVNFQSLIYGAGEVALGQTIKRGGYYPKPVKDACTLKIASIKQGSLIFELTHLGSEQETLETENISQQSMNLTYAIAVALNEDKYAQRLKTILPDPLSRKRILDRFSAILPTSEDSTLELALDSKKSQTMKFSHRQTIEQIIPKIELADSKKITGRLTKLRVDGKKEFQIDSAEGLISGEYDSIIEDFFAKNLGKLVEIEAKIDPKYSKAKLLVSQNSNYKQIDSYPIQVISIFKKTVSLKKPLNVDVRFDETNTYIFYEPEFKILATGKKFDEALEDFDAQFAILYNEYAKASDSSLTKTARELKKKILTLTGE